MRLSLNGDRLHYEGPEKAIERKLPAMRAHRDDLLECVKAVSGTLTDPDSRAPYLPWGQYLGAGGVQRFRANLVGCIERLADMEGWPDEHRDDVLARAIRGPLADLLPNLRHFNERLTEVTAEEAAREKIRMRSWRFDR
ncbi:hypothetical protein [Paraburkholderia sp. BL10I2N1]|uniref:hypothetical protein n=1 Tax=Paraburkholderia sp. BL10I2N1 TaxID=1938796 RepID=UPI00105FA448|nr:hypothetical protein [Paraburkholderia sp. BL10I2N1]